MDIALIFICLLLSALFSGVEVMFLSASRFKIQVEENQDSPAGKLMAEYVASPTRFIISCLIGNSLALVIFGFLMIWLIEEPLLNWGGADFLIWVIVISTALSALVLLVIGEYLPKILGKIFAERIFPVLALPVYILFRLFWLPVFMVEAISALFLRIMGIRTHGMNLEFISADLEKIIQDHSSGKDSIETSVDAELIENALYLKNLKVRECMVPRKELTAIDINDSIEELIRTIVRTYHSRIIVYKDNVDNVLGYVHHFDLHKQPAQIADILIPIKVVPESMPLQTLLNILIKDNKSIAWVVNEYGGTAGVITLEDILEEIFGEIDDEYDNDEYIENRLSRNEFILSGRLEIDRINEEYDLDIPEGDYETLSGMLVSHIGSIPGKNEEIRVGKYHFRVLDVSDTKIETVKLTIQESSDTAD